jgi:glycosyltransferase involved in cell wall biosynthesis
VKIVVNARHLSEESVGIGQYLRQIVFAMSDQLTDIELILVTHVPVDIDFGDRIKVVVVPEVGFFSGFKKQYWEQILISKYAKSILADAIWLPYPSLVRNFPGKIITTVHDLIPWKIDGYCNGFSSKLARWFSYEGIKKSDAICCVSETIRNEVSDFFSIERSEIAVTFNSLPINFKPKTSNEDLLKKFNIKKPYALYLGGFDKRKSVDVLCDSFSQIDRNLILIGKCARNSSLYLSPDVLSKSSDNISAIGFVDDGDLWGLFEKAEVFVHASISEGFNIPILMAQASNCPIICTESDINKEIAPYSIRGDMSNINFIKDSLDRIKNEREKIIQDGLNSSKRFVSSHSGYVLLEKIKKTLN